MKKLYIFTIIASLFALASFSQTIGGITYYTPTIAGTTVTTQNISKPSAFVIDHTGNKWIGFNSGTATSFQLIKFNGAQWDTFPAFNAVFATNKVNALAVDASNNLWIGSNAGLTKYNGINFTTYNTSNSTIISNTITALSCNSGNVYVGTNSGLSVFNGSAFVNYSTANGMNSNTVVSITAESPTAVWIGNTSGLDKFNGSSFSFTHVTSNNTADVVNCIYIDTQNNKWLGTSANGVIKYDNANFYTLPQLYPPSTTEDILGGTKWPTIVKSICKGLHGGALFSKGVTQPPAGTGLESLGGHTNEITNTQFYSYPNLSIGIATPTTSAGYSVMQFDATTNKLFYTTYSLYPSASILASVDLSTYTPLSYQFDVSASNSAFLDINNINALITDNSQQHCDIVNGSGESKYFTSKQTGTSPLYASAMWIGGYTNNDLRVAAMTYRQSGYDFWPGPLNAANASIDSTTAANYDHVWKVNRFEIANFIYNWNAGNVQNGTFATSASIMNWPGNSLWPGQTMAPYFDNNNDGAYNYMQGDYPLIKGDQMIWSVYNDNFNKHFESSSIHNMGIEVHASAYAFTCPNIADSNVVLNNTTFYNYQIFNRSINTYTNTYIGLWMDTRLGNYADNYIGCDVTNDFGYTYNGDGYDEDNYGQIGYHHNLPVFACNILSGPLADANDGIDNNHNCVVDEAGEKCLMGGFSSFNNTAAPLNGNPGAFNGTGPIGYYNLLRSIWETGPPMTYGNLGLNATSSTSPPCKYLFPGTTDPYGYGLGGNCSNPIAPPIGSANWTEGSVAGNNPGNRRFMTNIGPFTMQPAGMYEVDYALVFTQDSATCDTNQTCLIARATQDNKRVKHWFNTNTYPSCLSLVGVGIKQNTAPQLNLKLYPNPANTNVYVEFTTSQKNVTIEVYDMLGKLVRGFQYNELDKYAIIPVADLQSGLYMVKTTTAEGLSITKFVKE
ncbi:MAG: T9SS type A sorting domain-containing protein [Bacteroidia bacterium]